MSAAAEPTDGVWQHRNFRVLFGARVADTAGNVIAIVALAFAVLDISGSASDVGLVVGARSTALLVFVLLGGVIADRWSRSVVLVWSNLLSAVTQGVIAALVLTDNASISSLVALSLINGSASAVSFPASGALITETVPKRLLQQANATIASGTNTMNLIGLVGGAALVAAIGPGWGLAVDAVSFGVTAWLFARLHLPAAVGAEGAGESMLTDLRVGWRVFWSLSWVRAVVIGFLVINAAYSGAITVLGPAIADDGIGRAKWGWVLGAQAVGVLVATVALARSGRSLRLWTGMLVSTLIVSWIFMLGVQPTLLPLLATSFLTGVGLGLFGPAWDTSLQVNVSGEHLARVYSFDMLGSILALPIGQVVVGPIAEEFGRRNTLVGAAALALVASVGVLATPSVRSLPAPMLD